MEKNPNKKESAESGVEQEFIAEAAERVAARFDSLKEKLTENGDEESLQKLKSIFEKYIGTLKYLMLASVLVLPPDDLGEKTHEEVEISNEYDVNDQRVFTRLDEEGNTEYWHNDETTTKILNYLSGRGEVTDEMLSFVLQKDMFNILRLAEEPVESKEIRNYLYSIKTKADLVDFYKKYFFVYSDYIEANYSSVDEWVEDRIEGRRNKEEESRSEINPEFYVFLWELFRFSGSPRIEIVDSFVERPPRMNRTSGGASYFWTGANNGEFVVYLDLAEKNSAVVATLIQEMSHSFDTYKNLDDVRVASRYQSELLGDISKLKPEQEYEERKKLYVTKGTPEYRAHSIIWPHMMDAAVPFYPAMASEKKQGEELLQKWRESLE